MTNPQRTPEHYRERARRIREQAARGVTTEGIRAALERIAREFDADKNKWTGARRVPPIEPEKIGDDWKLELVARAKNIVIG